jgi:peptide-methionine (S)-S-oxide reductase
MFKMVLVVAVWCLIQPLSAQRVCSEGSAMNDQSKPEERPVPGSEVTTLGGGCFWCLEAVFEELEGVKRVASGYAGGTVKNPTYQDVCAGTTGHAEVVQIEFDPGVIGYGEILDVFFGIHDPTTLNRQGADMGSQYRSVIFYHDDQQKQIAGEKIKDIDSSNRFNRPIVTQLEPFRVFYEAENYHQDYFKLNPEAGYCRVVIEPKLHKFRDMFENKLK